MKKNNSEYVLPQFIIEQKTKEFKLYKQPNTPQATKFYKSNFIIEMFNQNKISDNKLQFMLLMEKIKKYKIIN
ncbi:unnamed protein product [Paramecium pentaurelia]|uniref:Uncharacterized protein n=1 Tax=Paramecium pentaurelia TaxID=43138 RepID=A0A8S1YGQ4_9CILI|nr:unnamed protein product [Paramecium pentaurelia]